MDEWNEAIDEYHFLENNPVEPDELELRIESFEEELDNCIICMGYILDAIKDEPPSDSTHHSSLVKTEDYFLLCGTKSIKTLRAIKALTENNIGADCLPLVRHIFELYFHIIYILNNPQILEHLVDAVVRIKFGTHAYAKTPKIELTLGI